MRNGSSPCFTSENVGSSQPRSHSSVSPFGQFSSGVTPAWEFARKGESIKIDPTGPLLVRIGAAADLAVDVAVSGTGVVYLFEDWLRPYFDRGELVPVLEPWWPRFSGPFLYYPGRRHLPATLRAFVDFVKALPPWETGSHAGVAR